jgi:hypothetical protein
MKKAVYLMTILAAFFASNAYAIRSDAMGMNYLENTIIVRGIRASEQAEQAMDYAERMIEYFKSLNPHYYGVGIARVNNEIASLLHAIAVFQRNRNNRDAVAKLVMCTKSLLNAVEQIESSYVPTV